MGMILGPSKLGVMEGGVRVPKIASYDGSGLSPQTPAVVHILECFSSFIDQRLDFGSGKSFWLQDGNVGSESICLNSHFAPSESIDKAHPSVCWCEDKKISAA
ncbi:hypothetical protein F2Q70_00033284 [Brassica cretica]|uniref:Uncharacterized protein n=1 Tax=Brassica cretica TaxID=69181 RepID=A0A8S9FQ39_BRACR|nr:hypothetical protein F2Q70_00033284 [Brassica cretica]